MNYTFIDNCRISSSFIKEEYFPAIIEFSNEELNNHFLEFNYKDTDMFEISVNPDSSEIKRFSLTLCNHFSFEAGSLSIPAYKSGSIIIDGPDTTECDIFSVKVYDDGIRIETSLVVPTKYLKCGQLIFGLTMDDTLSSLLVIDLSPTDIEHVKAELGINILN